MSRLKRALDLAVSSTVLAVTSPLMLATAVAVRATMGSPVLFRQPRPGRGGAPFELAKFRTMRAVRRGEEMVSSDADRMTKLGGFLRRTSLDELPTLLSVLRGDMSLVGPRPLLVRYLDRYTSEQARRHELRPGITGWAQVNGRNQVTWEQKLALDVWYVEHRSLVLDLRILARTAGQVLRSDGISHDGSATMPEFLGTRSSQAAPG